MTDDPPESAFRRYLAAVEPRRPRGKIPRREIVIATVLGLVFLALYVGPVVVQIWRK